VCSHVNEYAPASERYATVASIAMDLNAETFDVTDGLPCVNPYQRVSLRHDA
jgi:hypothetical protein